MKEYIKTLNEDQKPSTNLLNNLKTINNQIEYIYIQPFNLCDNNGNIIDTINKHIKIYNIPDEISDNSIEQIIDSELISDNKVYSCIMSHSFDFNRVQTNSNIKKTYRIFKYENDENINEIHLICKSDGTSSGYFDLYNITQKAIVCQIETIETNDMITLISTPTILNQPQCGDIIELRIKLNNNNNNNNNFSIYYLGIY